MRDDIFYGIAPFIELQGQPPTLPANNKITVVVFQPEHSKHGLIVQK